MVDAHTQYRLVQQRLTQARQRAQTRRLIAQARWHPAPCPLGWLAWIAALFL